MLRLAARLFQRVRVLFVPLAFLAIGHRAEAQQPFRSALPARPNINVPQAAKARPAPNPQFNAAANQAPNNPDMGGNPGFQPRSNRNFNGYGYSPWNNSDWNAWNGYSPYGWNTFMSINTMNPAMSWSWTAPAWQNWNTNPYMFNANMNPMWNNFNMNPGWNQMGIGFGGVPVGNWNGFNPAMLMNLNGGAVNNDFPR